MTVIRDARLKGMARKTMSVHRSIIGLLCLGASSLIVPTAVEAQCSWEASDCSWWGTVPVYLNPNNFLTDGYSSTDILAMERDIEEALRIWNEESGGHINLVYAGQTSLTGPEPYTIIINGARYYLCSWMCSWCWNDTPLGYGWPHDCFDTGSEIRIFTRDCTHAANDYQFGWDPVFDPFRFATLLTHELGHAAIGMNHYLGSGCLNSVMNPAIANRHIGGRHLYSVDIAKARTNLLLTWERAKVSTSTDGTSFGAPEDLGFYSNFPPSIGNRAFSSATMTAITFTDTEDIIIKEGRPGAGWTTHPSAWEMTRDTVDRRYETAIAVSDFGEVLVAWRQSPCHIADDCGVYVGWAAMPGGSWVTGWIWPSALSGPDAFAGTVTQPAVVYDPLPEDKFVLFFIGSSEQEIYSANTPAASMSWTSPVLADTGQHYRALGSAVINHATGEGLLTATMDKRLSSSTWAHRIYQMRIVRTGGNYFLGSRGIAGSGKETMRPFGMAFREDTGEVLLAFHRPYQDGIWVARKFSLSPSVYFGTPVKVRTGDFSGVDLAFNDGEDEWYLTFTE